jgi:hypothetical protein
MLEKSSTLLTFCFKIPSLFVTTEIFFFSIWPEILLQNTPEDNVFHVLNSFLFHIWGQFFHHSRILQSFVLHLAKTCSFFSHGTKLRHSKEGTQPAHPSDADCTSRDKTILSPLFLHTFYELRVQYYTNWRNSPKIT